MASARAAARFEAEGNGAIPAGLSEIVIGAAPVGEALVDDHRVPLISATGSTGASSMTPAPSAASSAAGVTEAGTGTIEAEGAPARNASCLSAPWS